MSLMTNTLSETVSHIHTVASRAGYHSISVILADPANRIAPDMTRPEASCADDWHEVPWAAHYSDEPEGLRHEAMSEMLDRHDPFRMHLRARKAHLRARSMGLVLTLAETARTLLARDKRAIERGRDAAFSRDSGLDSLHLAERASACAVRAKSWGAKLALGALALAASERVEHRGVSMYTL